MQALRQRDIEVTIGTYAVSAQPYYSAQGDVLPNSLRAYEQSLSLPLHTGMTEADIDEVAATLQGSV